MATVNPSTQIIDPADTSDQWRDDMIARLGTGDLAGLPQLRFPFVDITKPPYNADPTGTTASTQAFKDAIAAIGVGSTEVRRGKIVIPPGIYKIDDELLIDRASIEFEASEGAILWWTGPANKSMFRVIHSERCVWDGLVILGSKTAMPGDTAQPGPPLAAINFDQPSSSSVSTNEFHVVRRCQIGSRGNGATHDYPLQNGIIFGGAEATDNDQFVIEQCYINACTNSGIRIDNAQSVWGVIRDTLLNQCEYGINTGASVQLVNVQFNRCARDLNAHRAISVICTGYWSENSEQSITLAQGASLSIDGGRILVQDDSVTPTLYWCRGDPADRVMLRNLEVVMVGVATPQKFKYYPVTDIPGRVIIENCDIPGYSETLSDWSFFELGYNNTPWTLIVDGTDISRRKAVVHSVDFGLVSDRLSVGVTLTGGSVVVTGSGFASTDVGKLVAISGAGVASANFYTTISAFTNATTISLAAAPTASGSFTMSYGTDNSPAMQAMFDAAATGSGVLEARIYGGNYMMGSAVTPSAYTNIVGGDGLYVSLFPALDGPAFDLSALQYVSVRGITFDGSCSDGAIAIKLGENSKYVRIEQNFIWKFAGRCVEMIGDGYQIDIDRNQILQSGSAIVITNDAPGFPTRIRITRNTMEALTDNAVSAVLIENAVGVKVADNIFQSNANLHQIRMVNASDFNQWSAHIIDRNYFENTGNTVPGSTCVFADGPAAIPLYGVKIRDNEFHGTDPQLSKIALSNTNFARVSGNVGSGAGGYGVKLSGTNTNYIVTADGLTGTIDP